MHVFFFSQNGFKWVSFTLVADWNSMNDELASPRLHSGAYTGVEGRKAARRRGFSDLWQMAVLNIRDKPGTCSAGGNKGIKRRKLPARCLSIWISTRTRPVLGFEAAESRSWLLWSVRPAVMWAHCLHAVEISERACACEGVCAFVSFGKFETLTCKNSVIATACPFPRPSEREHCSHDNVSRVEWTRFSTTDSSTTRTKGGFASLDVRDRVHFNVPLEKRKKLRKG